MSDILLYMPSGTKKAIWILAILSCGLALFIYVKNLPPPSGEYQALARCITMSGTKFYGAFWCPHCREQKNEFGDAANYLPYVECSTPNGSGEFPACVERGIQHYPTWIFPDGSKLEGVATIQALADRT